MIGTGEAMRAVAGALLSLLAAAGCRAPGTETEGAGSARAMGRFGKDVEFLERHTDGFVLADGTGRAVAVVPMYQGRVMTSTTGMRGESLGWMNRALIASGERREHIHPYGGEDRFWLGPEGGPFGLFFEPGEPYDFEHWQTPPPIDSEPWTLVSRNGREAVFEHRFTVRNAAGTNFEIAAARAIRLLDRAEVERALEGPLPDGVREVAFESVNRIANAGREAWRPETGLVSIWILGMFPPSPRATVVVPIEEGPHLSGVPEVRADYFGVVPPERLRVSEDVVFFRADGRYRSKIGVPPERARDRLGAWDPEAGVLTIVRFTLPEPRGRYVNSLWQEQADPYDGDVVNSYNDGPLEEGGEQLGPFFELETSSPGLALAPGEEATHVHQTIHLLGNRAGLDAVARRVLGVDLDEIERALPEPSPR